MNLDKPAPIKRAVNRLIPLLILTIPFLISPNESHAEFYKYVDEDGVTHFVDSMDKIPKEFRQDLTTYEEKYDHLPQAEREHRIEEDRREAEELQRQKAEELERRRRNERIANEELLKKQLAERLAEEKRREQIAQEEYQKSLQTKVIIDGNSVMVPCKLGYDKYEAQALLILDTGSDLTTLHDDVAEKLHFKNTKRSLARVASGGTVGFKIGQLKYIQVGPFRKENMYVGIIKHRGPQPRYNGLLGMNFLLGVDYKIDYFNQVIRWEPRQPG